MGSVVMGGYGGLGVSNGVRCCRLPIADQPPKAVFEPLTLSTPSPESSYKHAFASEGSNPPYRQYGIRLLSPLLEREQMHNA